jgi:hypothetical protein
VCSCRNASLQRPITRQKGPRVLEPYLWKIDFQPSGRDRRRLAEPSWEFASALRGFAKLRRAAQDRAPLSAAPTYSRAFRRRKSPRARSHDCTAALDLDPGCRLRRVRSACLLHHDPLHVLLATHAEKVRATRDALHVQNRPRRPISRISVGRRDPDQWPAPIASVTSWHAQLAPSYTAGVAVELQVAARQRLNEGPEGVQMALRLENRSERPEDSVFGGCWNV